MSMCDVMISDVWLKSVLVIRERVIYYNYVIHYGTVCRMNDAITYGYGKLVIM